MLRTLLSRRRREDERTDNFLHAIRLSARYTVDPDWQLLAVLDVPQPATQLDETRALPLSLVTLLVPAVAG